MNLGTAAESLAIQIGKGNDYEFIESLKVDIIAARTIAIKNEYLRTGQIDQSLVQNINCLNFKKTYDKRCGTSDGFILRSEKKIPKPMPLGQLVFISLHNVYLGKYNRKSIDIITPEDVQDIEYRTFTSNNFYAVYENEHIDIIGENISKLNGNFKGVVRGIFTDPRKVKELKSELDDNEFCEDCDDCKNCDEEDTTSLDSCFETDTFEIEDYYFTDIQRIILAKKLGTYGNSNVIKINE